MTTILSGYYTSTAAAREIVLPSDVDWFELKIQGNTAGDNWNSNAATGVIKEAYWYRGMTNDTALGIYNVDNQFYGRATFVASAGFTPIDLSNPPVNAPITLAAAASISRAAAAVVTSAAPHRLQTGDLVRIENVLTMTQLNGVTAQITKTGATTFTIPIDTSGFAADGDHGTVTKIYVPQSFPSNFFISKITQANPGVITTTVNHGMSAGGKIRLVIPPDFGMTQANGLIATIVSVTATTITTDLDTSGFTAFAYPVVALYPVTFAQIVPVGEKSQIFSEAITNQWTRGMQLGVNVVGPNDSLVLWKAGKSMAINPS